MCATASLAQAPPGWPDPIGALRQWADAHPPADDAATPMARDAWQAWLAAIEQQAALAERWVAMVSVHLRDLERIARGAAGKAGRADDGAALWGTELEFLGEAAELGSVSLQAAWMALLDSQSRLSRQWLESQGEIFRRLLHTAAGSGGALDEALPSGPADVAAAGAPWLQWMSQATREAQAATLAFAQAIAQPFAADGPPQAGAEAASPGPSPTDAAAARANGAARPKAGGRRGSGRTAAARGAGERRSSPRG